MIKRPRAWLFTPERPEPLAMCRIAYCGLLLIYFTLFKDYRGWSALTETFHNPYGLHKLFPPPPSDAVVGAIQWVWWLSLFTSAMGLLTRTSLIVAAVGATYLMGIPVGYGKFSHSEPIVLLVLLILAASRCGDAWSVDAWRAGKTKVMSGEYRWPIRAVWILMSLVFFQAGLNKLVLAGPAWATPESFAPMMVRHFYTNDPPIDLALRLAWIRPFVWMAAISSLAGETLFPLALFSRRARLILPLLMFSMQVNIALLMGVYFWPFKPAYVFWVPWPLIFWGRWGILHAKRGSVHAKRSAAQQVEADFARNSAEPTA